MSERGNGRRDKTQIPNEALPAQASFLTAVMLLNPGVLQSLRKLSGSQTRLPARRELKEWARQSNLEADCVIEWVAQTIKWQRNGPSRRWDRFYHPLWSPKSRSERKPPTLNEVMQLRIREIDFGDWIGNPKTRSAVLERANQTFLRILTESLEEVETKAQSAGLFEPRTRRRRGSTKKSFAPQRSKNEAFLWLAGYQTCAWSRGRIADAVDVKPNAVGMRIRDLATELKIDLRPAQFYDENQTSAVIGRMLKKVRREERAYESFLRE
jgi:hypothetical protein